MSSTQPQEESNEKRTNANTIRDATLSECSVPERCTLTDAERESVRFYAAVADMGGRNADATTLRGLLERLK
jgi:hypothetical protein